jgi:hypothetical protein
MIWKEKEKVLPIVPPSPFSFRKKQQRGFEPSQPNANSALKVLYIEQLGLPNWIRTYNLAVAQPNLYSFGSSARCMPLVVSLNRLV